MRRREFIRLVVLSTATLSPMDARAQQSAPVIGVLGASTAGDYGPMITAFRKGLSETGYIEGKNVTFEYVWADNHYERLPALAAKLTERPVNVILAAATASALVAKSATSTIPIVFAIGGDPVRTGLVSSLERPGGNVTGAAHINVDTAPKRLELLHELLPGRNSVGLLTNPTSPLTPSVESGVKAAAKALGIKLTTFHASTDEEIEATFRNATGPVAGLVIGVGASMALVTYLATFLYGITTRDTLTFVSVPVVVVAVAAAACIRPALRASRIDPIQTMRGN